MAGGHFTALCSDVAGSIRQCDLSLLFVFPFSFSFVQADHFHKGHSDIVLEFMIDVFLMEEITTGCFEVL